MINQNIVSLFKNIKDDNDWNVHCFLNPDDCTFDPDSGTKNNARNNFGIDHREEILFIRDTSFWNDRNQGLVLTDAGLYCIPDNDNPEDKIQFSWDIVKQVVYKDACLYFYGYGDDAEDVCPIHISYFTKNAEEYEISDIGLSIASFLTQIASSVNYVDPFVENYEKVGKLVNDGKKDEAISFLKNLIAQDDGTYKSYWNLRLSIISLSGNTDGKEAASYCEEGLKCCEDGSPVSILLWDQHRNAILQQIFSKKSFDCNENLGDWDQLQHSTLLQKILEESDDNVNFFHNVQTFRRESLLVSQLATDQQCADKRFMKDDAMTDFIGINSFYCQNFIKQPYNTRKVVLVVKDYTDLRQDSLCVIRKSDIPSDISFPIGHPQENQIYVGHPFIPTKYVPFEEYQLEFIEDKIREFTWLMQCMGATKISISAKNDNEQSGDYLNNHNVTGNSSYAVAKANGSYSSNSKGSFAEQICKAISLNQEFNPTKAPFIPDGLVWYKNEPSWQRLVNQRITGSLMHASESIESRKSNMVNGSELQTIKAEFHSLVSLDGEWTKEEEAKFQQQENATLTFEIEFAPIESLGANEENKTKNIKLPLSCKSISSDEQEYLDEVKECLADGEIGPRERKFLDRFASRLGISHERAKQLESSFMLSSLYDEEKEYFKEVEFILEDGEIGLRERKTLDRFASRLGISPERAKEIEALAAKK